MKKIIIVLGLLCLILLLYIKLSNLHEYRPMIFLQDNLYIDSELVDSDTLNDMVFVGIINDVVASTKKPKKNLQSNELGYLNAKVYISCDGEYYLSLSNGSVLKMEIVHSNKHVAGKDP